MMQTSGGSPIRPWGAMVPKCVKSCYGPLGCWLYVLSDVYSGCTRAGTLMMPLAWRYYLKMLCPVGVRVLKRRWYLRG